MKGKLITYWISTVLVSAFMAFNAYNYLVKEPKLAAALASLGYPPYFLTILGVAKLLGVVALLAPAFPRLKEWAYAGFTFTFIGATWSHLASNQPQAIAIPIASLVVLVISYMTRLPTRRIPWGSAAVIEVRA